MYGTLRKRDWMTKVVFLIQILLTFGGGCNRYFWNIRLKILRLPNFNMLFQLVLTKLFKSEVFSWLPKVGQVIKSCKEPIVFYNVNTSFPIMIHVLPPICKYTRISFKVHSGKSLISWLRRCDMKNCQFQSCVSAIRWLHMYHLLTSFRTSTADRLNLVMTSGFCFWCEQFNIWCEQFVFDASNLHLM